MTARPPEYFGLRRRPRTWRDYQELLQARRMSPWRRLLRWFRLSTKRRRARQ